MCWLSVWFFIVYHCFPLKLSPYFPYELSLHIFPFGGQTSKLGRDHVRREMVALRAGLWEVPSLDVPKHALGMLPSDRRRAASHPKQDVSSLFFFSSGSWHVPLSSRITCRLNHCYFCWNFLMSRMITVCMSLAIPILPNVFVYRYWKFYGSVLGQVTGYPNSWVFRSLLRSSGNCRDSTSIKLRLRPTRSYHPTRCSLGTESALNSSLTKRWPKVDRYCRHSALPVSDLALRELELNSSVGKWLGCGIDDRGFGVSFLLGVRVVLCFATPRPAPGPAQLPIQWINVKLFLYLTV